MLKRLKVKRTFKLSILKRLTVKRTVKLSNNINLKPFKKPPNQGHLKKKKRSEKTFNLRKTSPAKREGGVCLRTTICWKPYPKHQGEGANHHPL
jgi:hypothetical protein